MVTCESAKGVDKPDQGEDSIKRKDVIGADPDLPEVPDKPDREDSNKHKDVKFK